MPCRLLVSFVGLGLLAAGCGSPSNAVRGSDVPPVLMFSCCTAATVHRVYHPGEVITLHWMRSTGAQGRDKGAETLKARLDGPFSKVAQAKAPGALGIVQATGKPIRVPPTASAPVSTLRIPAGAKPGLYNLVTTDVEGPGSLHSKSIIRVVDPGN